MSTREPSPTTAVISFEEVSLSSSESAEGFSLRVGPGEMAIFECPRHRPLPDILGVALGLRTPDRGTVRFHGTDWENMAGEEAENCRFRAGAVFRSEYRASFLANLDVDENVHLAQLMNPETAKGEVVERADALAKRFGLTKLPSVRPAKANRQDLLRSQWVRAFLPNPLELLILERPAFGMPPNAIKLLAEQIQRVRDAGTAVFWIDVPPRDLDYSLLSPTILFEQPPPGLLLKN